MPNNLEPIDNAHVDAFRRHLGAVYSVLSSFDWEVLSQQPHLCRTCRRWAPFSNGWLGQCVLPPEPNDDRIGIEFEWDGDNCREEVRVNTHAEYGCVLWEAQQDD